MILMVTYSFNINQASEKLDLLAKFFVEEELKVYFLTTKYHLLQMKFHATETILVKIVGTCSGTMLEYQCACLDGYTGNNCES